MTSVFTLFSTPLWGLKYLCRRLNIKAGLCDLDGAVIFQKWVGRSWSLMGFPRHGPGLATRGGRGRGQRVGGGKGEKRLRVFA